MTRKEFISKLGIGAAFALTATCLGSCGITTEPDIEFMVDLQDITNQALLNDGGYKVINQVVVARTTQGDYVAATVVCSHDQEREIILKNDEWFCTAHDARFDLSGNGLNDLGKKGLFIYQVKQIDANTLRVSP